jgi:predicted DNA-binding protein with PD1-like motif
VSFSVHRSEKSRHLVLRASAGENIPDALATKLRDEQVACGWLRASGVLVDVELRAFDAELGTLGSTRRIAGPVQVLALEGSIGLVDGEPSFSLRALLARETDHGLETLAGEIASARVVALEILVTAFDDLALERTLDEPAGVWLLGTRSSSSAPARVMMKTQPAAPPAPPIAWTSALEASERAVEREPQRARPTATFSSNASSAPIPQRPARPPAVETEDGPLPEPGDSVEHFAFGRADVVKSDGDRLHVKIHKDGRIKEIALEMLRVSRLEDAEGGKRRFKLERRM